MDALLALLFDALVRAPGTLFAATLPHDWVITAVTVYALLLGLSPLWLPVLLWGLVSRSWRASVGLMGYGMRTWVLLGTWLVREGGGVVVGVAVCAASAALLGLDHSWLLLIEVLLGGAAGVYAHRSMHGEPYPHEEDAR